MKHTTQTKMKPHWKAQLGYSCAGPRCPHEVLENHWVVTLEDIESILELERKELVERVSSMEFKMNIDEYLPLVKGWNGTNFDKPFDDGYRIAKENVLALLKTN